MSQSERKQSLTPEERVCILHESYAPNQTVQDVAASHGVHRTTVYEIRRSADAILKDVWAAQRPGRPRSGVPQSYSELKALVESEQQELERLRGELAAKEKAGMLKDVRIEFLEFAVELYKKRAPEKSSARRRKRK